MPKEQSLCPSTSPGCFVFSKALWKVERVGATLRESPAQKLRCMPQEQCWMRINESKTEEGRSRDYAVWRASWRKWGLKKERRIFFFFSPDYSLYKCRHNCREHKELLAVNNIKREILGVPVVVQ